MERLRKVMVLALGSGALALCSGCVTADANKQPEARKPDVTQPGVLPPPQNMVRPAPDSATQSGAVVQAGATEPAAAVAAPAAHHAPASPLSKLTSRLERKTPATEIGVGWRNRIAHLPDPARSGTPGPGLVGQMFLFGGAKLDFVDADGTLTVDLIDETPGKPPAKAERWQFNKELLLKMRTTDETFGRSYVLFLPWPAYRPDITRVRISARYDPDDARNGHTLFSPPAVITLDGSTPHGAPVWDGTPSTSSAAPGAGGMRGQPASARPLGSTGAIPLGGPPGGASQPVRSVDLTPPAAQPEPLLLPLSPTPPAPNGAPAALLPLPVAAVPSGIGPVAPPLPPGLEPIAITVGKP